jgi:hypothetical protein
MSTSEKTVAVIPLTRIEVSSPNGTEVHDAGGDAFLVSEAEAERLCSHTPPSAKLVDGAAEAAPVTTRRPTPQAPAAAALPLEKRQRPELEAIAHSVGVPDPKALENKGKLIAAIRAKQEEAARSQGNPVPRRRLSGPWLSTGTPSPSRAPARAARDVRRELGAGSSRHALRRARRRAGRRVRHDAARGKAPQPWATADGSSSRTAWR